MHEAIKDYIRHYKGLSSSKERYAFVMDVNKIVFIEELRNAGVQPKESSKFITWLCEQQISRNEPLPTHGYLDLVNFAKDKKLFSKDERKKALTKVV